MLSQFLTKFLYSSGTCSNTCNSSSTNNTNTNSTSNSTTTETHNTCNEMTDLPTLSFDPLDGDGSGQDGIDVSVSILFSVVMFFIICIYIFGVWCGS